MYAEERQHEIVTRARELGRVSVADLAPRDDGNPDTNRRDLDSLAGRGLVSRVHGGAVPADKLLLGEPSVTAREVSSPEEKLVIAQKAIGLLPHREGLTVLVDAGTTTGRLCGLLPSWVGLVVTNSVPAAAVLSQQEGRSVWLLGGQVRGITQAVVGPPALATLARLRVDVAFLGTNGFSVAHGFSTPDPSEAAVKRAMVASAREAFVLTDSSKLGVDHLVQFASLEDVDALVTDSGLPEASVAELRAAGMRVEVA